MNYNAKARLFWPSTHDDRKIKPVKQARCYPLVVDIYGRYDCAELRELEKRALCLPATPEVVITEGEGVRRWSRVSRLLVNYATLR